MSDYDTIQEGPVTIEFSKSDDDRVKFSISVDFGKTDFSPSKASKLFKMMIDILRSVLGVKLSKCS